MFLICRHDTFMFLLIKDDVVSSLENRWSIGMFEEDHLRKVQKRNCAARKVVFDRENLEDLRFFRCKIKIIY